MEDKNIEKLNKIKKLSEDIIASLPKDEEKEITMLRSGDILEEDIYTVMGEKIGSIITKVIKLKGKVYKEVIADNGGVGFIVKGGRGEVSSEQDLYRCRLLGYNHDAKVVWEAKNDRQTK